MTTKQKSGADFVSIYGHTYPVGKETVTVSPGDTVDGMPVTSIEHELRDGKIVPKSEYKPVEETEEKGGEN